MVRRGEAAVSSESGPQTGGQGVQVACDRRVNHVERDMVKFATLCCGILLINLQKTLRHGLEIYDAPVDSTEKRQRKASNTQNDELSCRYPSFFAGMNSGGGRGRSNAPLPATSCRRAALSGRGLEIISFRFGVGARACGRAGSPMTLLEPGTSRAPRGGAYASPP